MAGASPTTLFGCSHPCQGTGWPRQHALVRSVHGEGWLVVLPAQPLAGAGQAGASRSLCFLRQQNTGAAGAGGTPQEPLPAPHKAIACSPPQVCVPPGPLCVSPLPSLLLAGRAGAGGAFPARLGGFVCGAVSCTATLPPGKGSWEMDVIVCQMGLREWSVPFLAATLMMWHRVFLVHIAVPNHTQVHPLPHTRISGRLQEALEWRRLLRAGRGEYGPGW